MELTYAVSGDSLRRTATRGSKTIADERCMRIPATPVPATCERPNVPPAVLTAVQPGTPPEVYQKQVSGVVHVRVVLDDRSRVLWVNVLSTPSAVLSDEALHSARDSTYRTRVVNCKSIPAVYHFSVEFE